MSVIKVERKSSCLILDNHHIGDGSKAMVSMIMMMMMMAGLPAEPEKCVQPLQLNVDFLLP